MKHSPPQRNITQAELASIAGVSQPTVQRVLSGRGYASEALRERVERLAREHGYRANAAAQSVRTGRFGQVALVLGTRSERGVVLTEMLDGFEQALGRRDLSMLVSRLPNERCRDLEALPKVFRAASVDGLLVGEIARPSAEQRELLDAQRVPVVWLKPHNEFDCVCFDDLGAGREAAEHLIGLGHRQIVFVDHGYWRDTRERMGTPARCTGYEEAMEEAGLAARVVYVPDNVPDTDRMKVGQQVLAEAHGATALLVWSRRMAIPLMYAAARGGVRVPEDLSLMTFSAGPCDEVGLEVTAMTISRRRFAERAVAMLQKRIADPSQHLPVETEAFELNAGVTVIGPP